MNHPFYFRPLTGAAACLGLALCACTTAATTASPQPTSRHNTLVKKEGKTASSARAKEATGPLYANRPDAMQAANSIALRLQIDPSWTRRAIGLAHYSASIARSATPPPAGTAKNWTVYRSRFIDPVRIGAGVKFWQANRDTLERAEQETGVPAAVVVGVIGVETIYGQQTGSYRVIDALCTLAFDFPKEHPRATERSAFFLSELEAFLKLTHRTGTDPKALRGSYAGAMGLPQFMPSSWDKYAVDFDADGRVDLFLSHADVIGSVANYLKTFRWQRGMPTHYPVQFNLAKLDKAALLLPDILPTFTPAAFGALGAELDAAGLQHIGPLALVELQNGSAEPLYLAGTENFYAITRYNWSSYYALAVIELGQAVADAMPK
ncbi:MAG: lytic murein transglycosylase B [Rhodoferax sp.]|nr:lytic murein transglycosylase B [Rhodoferax sp.]